MLSSHLTPSILALTRRRGERLGQGQSRPFRLCSTVSSFGQSKQTGLAPGQGGLSGVALPGQGIAWDRTGWDGRPLIDAAHYFHPRKLGQLQTERCHGNWGMGSQAEGFSSQLAQPHLSTQPQKNICTQAHKVKFLTLTDQQTFVGAVSEWPRLSIYIVLDQNGSTKRNKDMHTQRERKSCSLITCIIILQIVT